MDNKVAIVPLGEESGEVNRVLANETARRILDLISDEPLSTMRIAYKLNLAINTAQYNLERLEAVGLVEVVRVEKSKKGRDMKIYAPTNKIIAIVPKSVNTSGVYNALRAIMPLFLVALVLSVGVEFMAYSPHPSSYSTGIPSQAPIPRGGTNGAFVYGVNSSESTGPAKAAGGVEDDGLASLREAWNWTPQEAGETAAENTTGTANAENPAGVVGTQLEEAIRCEQVSRPAEGGILGHPGLWVLVGALVIIASVVLIRRPAMRF